MKNFFIKLFALCFVIGIILLINPSAKHNVFRYVKNNNSELAAVAEDIIEDNITVNSKYKRWNIDYYAQSDVPVVEFTVKSFGIGSSSGYKGFYYSPDNMPVGFQGVETVFVQNGDRFEYSYEGDNAGFTEKICENWYWFEMNF